MLAWRVLRSSRVGRVVLAGPGAVVTTLLVVLGMSLWIPEGPAHIDQLAFPLILLPLVWAMLFFHACLDRSLARAALVALGLCVLNGAAIAWHVGASSSSVAEPAR